MDTQKWSGSGAISRVAMASGTLSINVSISGRNKVFSRRFLRNELTLECDLQDLSIDSTSVKVHKDAGSKKELVGKSRGGNTTKIHVAVDALSNPVKVKLTAGQVHDVTVAPLMIPTSFENKLPNKKLSLALNRYYF